MRRPLALPALTYEANRARVFVDGKAVAEQAVKFQDGDPVGGDLSLGMLVKREFGCDGLVDELRVSDGVREIKSVPEGVFPADERTLGLWRFDGQDDRLVADVSKLKNPAKLVAVTPPDEPRPPSTGRGRPRCGG